MKSMMLLLVMVFLNIAGFSLILPLLPFYGSYFDASPFAIACLFASYSLGNVFGEIFWGRMSDLHGRRPVLIITTGVAALCYVAFAYAPNLLVAILLRIICGFFSGTFGVITGVIADVSSPENRAKFMGYFGAAFNLGFAFGPAIGGLLAEPDLGIAGFRLPIFVAAALAGSASIWSMLALPETLPKDGAVRSVPSYREAFKFVGSQPMLWRLFIIAFCGIAAFSSMEAVFGLWAELNFNWSAREVGLTFVAVGCTGLIVQTLLIGPLVAKNGEARVIILGLSLLSIAIISIPLMRLPVTTVVFMSLLMAGHSLAFPMAGTLVSRSTPPNHQGSVMGLNMASNALSRIIAPPLFGWLYIQHADVPYYVCAVLVLLLLPIAIQVVRIRDEQVKAG